MNYVTIRKYGTTEFLTAEQIVSRSINNSKMTAFLGRPQAAIDTATRLYMVAGAVVFDVARPWLLYANSHPFVVERWVDLDITVRE